MQQNITIHKLIWKTDTNKGEYGHISQTQLETLDPGASKETKIGKLYR